jgi:hypothetical protein
LPKQQEAFEAMFTHRYVLFGGPRGPGKSYWLRWTLLMYDLYLTLEHSLKGVRVGLFCEDYPSLQDRQIVKIKAEFPAWLGEVKSTITEGLGFYIKPRFGGGILSLRNLDDPSKYQSAEFAAIGVDQLEKNPYETFNTLRGSLRWPGVKHNPFGGTANPGGIGHLFVKQLWVDHNPPPELAVLSKEFKYIQALPKDNPYLPASYWEALETLPEPLRSAWLLGDWSIFAGQALSSWRPEKHVIPPRELPSHWPRWRSIDWGYAKPWCCLWWAKDPDLNRMYIYREAYEVQLTDSQQARIIKEMTPPTEKISITYADPSMWAKKNVKNLVTSTAQEYQEEGVVLTRADNDRLSGKRKLDRALAPLPDGLPGLQVFNTCYNTVRTLPALPSDPNNPEDVDTRADDHPYDTLRYGLTNVSIAPPQEQEVRSPLQNIKGL